MQNIKRKFITIFSVLYLLPSAASAELGVGQLSDLTLPDWNIGDPSITGYIDVCVYSDNSGPGGGHEKGSYAITVIGSSGYALASGSNRLPYSLFWDDSGSGSLGGSLGTELNNNVQLTGQVNADTKSSNCDGKKDSGPNARMTVRLGEPDLASALSGNYTGTVTLIVSPN